MNVRSMLMVGAASFATLILSTTAQARHPYQLAAQPALVNMTRTASGGIGQLSWQARSLIVGMTPTATTPSTGGGNPLFFPGSDKSGVLALIMDYGPDGAFICTGSLMSDRVSVLTAAHCVDGNPLSVTAYVFEDPNVRTPFNGRAIDVSRIMIHEGYTGDTIDQNDIAVLRLGNGLLGVDAYELHDATSLTGLDYNVAGYGTRSTGGAYTGENAITGYLREGDNSYDFRLGDALFGTVWSDILGAPYSQIEYSYLSDFDNGLALNDTACRITQASNFGGLPGLTFCDLGLGAREVSVGGGDSGGPQFVDGKITSVTSYGLSFGSAWGDCDNLLNSTCGEFNGLVPIHIHRDFIAGAMAVPEPATWGLMIAGFGLVGFAARRRTDQSAPMAG